MNLFQGIKMEYSKVQWPKKEEIVNSTLWVIVMSLVLSVYLGVFDLIASRLLKVLVSLFGGYYNGKNISYKMVYDSYLFRI